MLEGKGRLVVQMGKDGKPAHVTLYIPTDVARDSAFPLEAGEVHILVNGSMLVVKQ